jgi:hypothetical protein
VRRHLQELLFGAFGDHYHRVVFSIQPLFQCVQKTTMDVLPGMNDSVG